MNARERILDAAALVLRERGLAAATTREIARAAGCSEGLLYKHFADKQEMFMAVLGERMPRLTSPGTLLGTSSVVANLETLVAQLMDFYVESFPMAASILGTPSLRDAHRSSIGRHGGGPDRPAALVRAYLDAEIAGGRVDDHVDTEAVARVLTGAALFEAFQATYRGEESITDADATAHRLVMAVWAGISERVDPT